MKVEEFVSETLREIIGGVKEAQAYAKDNGAMVNPEAGWRRNNVPHVAVHGYLAAVKELDFDVAVTSTDSSETQAGAGQLGYCE